MTTLDEKIEAALLGVTMADGRVSDLEADMRRMRIDLNLAKSAQYQANVELARLRNEREDYPSC